MTLCSGQANRLDSVTGHPEVHSNASGNSILLNQAALNKDKTVVVTDAAIPISANLPHLEHQSQVSDTDMDSVHVDSATASSGNQPPSYINYDNESSTQPQCSIHIEPQYANHIEGSNSDDFIFEAVTSSPSPSQPLVYPSGKEQAVPPNNKPQYTGGSSSGDCNSKAVTFSPSPASVESPRKSLSLSRTSSKVNGGGNIITYTKISASQPHLTANHTEEHPERFELCNAAPANMSASRHVLIEGTPTVVSSSDETAASESTSVLKHSNELDSNLLSMKRPKKLTKALKSKKQESMVVPRRTNKLESGKNGERKAVCVTGRKRQQRHAIRPWRSISSTLVSKCNRSEQYSDVIVESYRTKEIPAAMTQEIIEQILFDDNPISVCSSTQQQSDVPYSTTTNTTTTHAVTVTESRAPLDVPLVNLLTSQPTHSSLQDSATTELSSIDSAKVISLHEDSTGKQTMYIYIYHI